MDDGVGTERGKRAADEVMVLEVALPEFQRLPEPERKRLAPAVHVRNRGDAVAAHLADPLAAQEQVGAANLVPARREVLREWKPEVAVNARDEYAHPVWS